MQALDTPVGIFPNYLKETEAPLLVGASRKDSNTKGYYLRKLNGEEILHIRCDREDDRGPWPILTTSGPFPERLFSISMTDVGEATLQLRHSGERFCYMVGLGRAESDSKIHFDIYFTDPLLPEARKYHFKLTGTSYDMQMTWEGKVIARMTRTPKGFHRRRWRLDVARGLDVSLVFAMFPILRPRWIYLESIGQTCKRKTSAYVGGGGGGGDAGGGCSSSGGGCS